MRRNLVLLLLLSSLSPKLSVSLALSIPSSSPSPSSPSRCSSSSALGDRCSRTGLADFNGVDVWKCAEEKEGSSSHSSPPPSSERRVLEAVDPPLKDECECTDIGCLRSC